jgi:type III restriction enzyme
MVNNLMATRGFSLEQLVYEKFRLRDAASKLIDRHRLNARQDAYQLIIEGTDLEVDASFYFKYPKQYPANWYYEGSYLFKKHFYPTVGELKQEGEEFMCAQLIDTLPNVKYWVRNLERRPFDSFWLQTSTDRFYPDFVALLNDGRFLVVEYKGQHLWDSEDSKEKRMLGKLWQDRSNGKAIFKMLNYSNFKYELNQIGQK